MSVGDTPGRAQNRPTEVEFSHMFSAGDGDEMVEALLEGFSTEHPGLNIAEKPITDHYELMLKSRILQNQSPDVFFGWPGNALKPYVDAGVVLDIDDVWERQGLERVYADGLIDPSRIDGKMRCVPVTIHRINNLFYNVELAEERGVDPGSIHDMRDFVAFAEQAHGDGIAGFGLPMKNPWTIAMVWGEMVAGHLGANAFTEVMHGNARPYAAKIEETIEFLDRLADLGFDQPHFVGMGEANERFMQGDAMCFQQGDWVAGAYAEREGFDYRREWDHVPFPGTDDTYVMGVDVMIASALGSNPEGARELLAYASSPEALQTINALKGSIPPREDVSTDDYPPFLQSQYEEYKRAQHTVPAAKGMLSPEAGVQQLIAAAEFITERDVQSMTERMIEVHDT